MEEIINNVINSVSKIVSIIWNKLKEMASKMYGFYNVSLKPLINKYGTLDRAGNILAYNEKLRKRRLLYVSKGYKKKRR